MRLAACDLLIGCVDSRAAWRTLHALAFKGHAVGSYWLNLGNTASTAQAVLGQPRAARRTSPSALKSVSPRLPCVTELFPELLDATTLEDHQPSCSVCMSLAGPRLFVNDVAVRFAAQLLYELFSTGRLSAHGVVVNLASKCSGPIEVDPRTWALWVQASGAC